MSSEAAASKDGAASNSQEYSGQQQKQQRSPLAQQAARLLHRRLKVAVKDGRVLIGELTCFDKQGNLILTNTYEQLQLNGRTHDKQMGQVLIPATHRVSCELEVMPHEAEQMEQLLEARGTP